MENNKKIAVVFFTEHGLSGDGWGGSRSVEGEPRRKKVLCRNMPEVLFWLFQGASLGDLERIVYSWAGAGSGDHFESEGKFLQRNGGWLENLDIRLIEIGEGAVWDDEAGNEAKDYASDVLSYLGIGTGGRPEQKLVS